MMVVEMVEVVVLMDVCLDYQYAGESENKANSTRLELGLC